MLGFSITSRGGVVVGLLGLAILAACGDDGPAGSGATTTSARSGDVVTETREITDDDLAILSDDDGHTPLGCAPVGGSTWDYGEVTEAEGGREPVDALLDAVADLNRNDGYAIPASGWAELVIDDGERIFVLEDESGSFTAAVTVSGDPAVGVWRHPEAYVCPTMRS